MCGLEPLQTGLQQGIENRSFNQTKNPLQQITRYWLHFIILAKKMPVVLVHFNNLIFLYKDYVEELYQMFLKSSKADQATAKELKDMTPAPMSTMLAKQPVAEALKKKTKREKKVVKDVPQTTPSGNYFYLIWVKFIL